MQALETAHKTEIKELINKWDNLIMPNFDNEAILLEIELKKKHQNELETFNQQYEKECETHKVHYSSHILDLQKKREILGQQGFYNEAKKIKKLIKQQQEKDKEKSEAS